MCKQAGRSLDDPWFDSLDPLLKVYMYEHWYRDQEEMIDLVRSHSILIGSFSNPKAASDMLKAENPDFKSSEEDFQNSLKMVQNSKMKSDSQRKRQKKKAMLSET